MFFLEPIGPTNEWRSRLYPPSTPNGGVYSMHRFCFLETNGPQMSEGLNYTPHKYHHKDMYVGMNRAHSPLGYNGSKRTMSSSQAHP